MFRTYVVQLRHESTPLILDKLLQRFLRERAFHKPLILNTT